MTAEIISIGDELLIGQVVNTNASWMATQLNLAGIRVYQITAVSDSIRHIHASLKEAAGRVDLILITGGLGPTRDDITKQALCEYFDTGLLFNEHVYNDIKNLFGKRGFKISSLNLKQAEIPENCTPIKNNHGTAPGMWFEKDGKIYISMPGVPFEMKAMVTDYVIPEVLKRFDPGFIIHKTILTQGLPESALAKKIESWENNLPDSIKLAYLPQPGTVRLRLSGTSKNKEELAQQISDETDKLINLISDSVFGFDQDQLQNVIGRLLRGKGMTLSTAESCTGGYIAHLITLVPGSSDYFKGSVVAYANEIKESELGVKHESLLAFGAVSEQVAIEMAEGIKNKFGTDYAIATTGIAGPAGGSEEKPVGTVWVAVSTPDKTFARHFLMGEDRQRTIIKTAATAFNLLRLEMVS